MIDLSEFIKTVFDDLPPDDVVCLCRNANINFTCTDSYLDAYEPGSEMLYFGVSSYVGQSGQFKRGRAQTREAYCLVLDDIGTKASEPPVRPSWVLESSAGNYQWGYLLAPLSVASGGDETSYYEACQRALGEAGFSDSGAFGTYRIMRVPGSLHKTGFVSRITEWSPDRFWDLTNLMSEFGLEPQYSKTVARVSMALNDPVVSWLRDNGHLLSSVPDSEGWLSVTCPNAGEHSDDSTSSGYNAYSGGFHCFHEHCAHLDTSAFNAWVVSSGGPIVENAGGLVAIPKSDLPDVRLTEKGVPSASQRFTDDNFEYVASVSGFSFRFDVLAQDIHIQHSSLKLPQINLIEKLRDQFTRCDIAAQERQFMQKMEAVARLDSFHPMVDWLVGLEAWDGEDRIGGLCETISSSASRLPLVYVRKWLIQAVAASHSALDSVERSFEHVLVLTGGQGIGKSTWFKSICPPAFFRGDATLQLSGARQTDEMLQALDKPIVEIGEIDASYTKSDVAMLKNFLSRRIDKIRAPYAAKALARPRATVFGATVNTADFLQDNTGSRRFWVIDVESIDRGLLNSLDIDQLWAQAYRLWLDGVQYHLTDAESEIQRAESENFRHISALEEAFFAFFTGGVMEQPVSDWVAMTTTEICERAGFPVNIHHPRQMSELNNLLDQQGWKRQSYIGGKRRARLLPMPSNVIALRK